MTTPSSNTRGPFLIENTPPDTPFPDVHYALEEPNGLLAIGGDLSPTRLLNAYRHGIFPWYNDDQPILWWSPDPRLVIYPERLHISRSMRKLLNKKPFRVTMDHAFNEVIEACSRPRPGQPETWLSPRMQAAYRELHKSGYAHSVEVWDRQGELVGGLYGVALGRVFFGESMFSYVSNASKLGFILFAEQIRALGFKLIDCQVETAHLASLGAENIPRETFIEHLDNWCGEDNAQNWKTEISDN